MAHVEGLARVGHSAVGLARTQHGVGVRGQEPAQQLAVADAADGLDGRDEFVPSALYLADLDERHPEQPGELSDLVFIVVHPRLVEHRPDLRDGVGVPGQFDVGQRDVEVDGRTQVVPFGSNARAASKCATAAAGPATVATMAP